MCDIDEINLGIDPEQPEPILNLANPRKIKTKNKRRMIKAMQKQRVESFLDRLPGIDESYHIIQNGRFDFFDYLPRILFFIDQADEAYLSTWTMNRENTKGLSELYQKNKLRNITLITGLYFMHRERAVFATLLDFMQKNNQKFAALKNHAKIIALANHKKRIYITIEGSANFTANPRIEQITITNNKNLFEFHKSWIKDAYNLGVQSDKDPKTQLRRA